MKFTAPRNLAASASLVGMPTLLLSTYLHRPAWAWILLFVAGTAAVFACCQHMTRVIALDENLNPPKPVDPPKPAADQLLAVYEALGLLPLIERLAERLARLFRKTDD